MLEALITELEAIEDPRCGWKVEHRLLDILVIAVCAVLGEAESFEDIALYGRANARDQPLKAALKRGAGHPTQWVRAGLVYQLQVRSPRPSSNRHIAHGARVLDPADLAAR